MYGKSELQPEEIQWLKSQDYIRTSFCKNLHAKCYLNEDSCIITSLNLYEFSQINNNEMGIFLSREDDGDVYKDAYEEAQRIIRVSDEVRISMEKIDETEGSKAVEAKAASRPQHEKLTTSKLATQLKLKTTELLEKLVQSGWLELKSDKHFITELGKQNGGEFRTGPHGAYFLWPADTEFK